MTGTAMTESDEFMKIYRLEVVAIPTNRPVNRNDHNDKIYRTTSNKYEMIVEEIHEMHRKGRPNDPFLLQRDLPAASADRGEATPGPSSTQDGTPIPAETVNEQLARIDEALKRFKNAENGDKETMQFMMETYDFCMGRLAMGRPVLVGTTSVENSEKLSRLLERTYGIEHEVLNAKNHAREAEIVAKAGHATRRCAATINTPGQRDHRDQHGRPRDGHQTRSRRGQPELQGAARLGNEGERALVARSLTLYPPGSTKCCIHCDEYDPGDELRHCYQAQARPAVPRAGPQGLRTQSALRAAHRRAPSVTNRGASTTSSAGGRAARATRVPAASSSRSRTICSSCSCPTGCSR